jgi:hypothetical protein
MAAVASDSELPSGKHCLFESKVDSMKCPNCLVLKEQLQFVPQELESANTIISFLKEDNNLTSVHPTLDGTLQSGCAVNMQIVVDPIWNPVNYKTNEKRTSIPNISRVTNPLITTVNRFWPLDNLKVNQGNEINSVNNNLLLNQGNETNPVNNSVKPVRNNFKENSTGSSKISTIINGIVTNRDIQNSCKIKPQTLKDKPIVNNTHTHKVHIIGDSHFKEITTKVDQYLGTNFVVSGFIKPGASVK